MLKMMKICSDKCVHCIFDQINYYALSINCSTDVKLELFRSYCTLFYCCYLWTAYKKSTFDKLRVAFNNYM